MVAIAILDQLKFVSIRTEEIVTDRFDREIKMAQKSVLQFAEVLLCRRSEVVLCHEELGKG